MIDRFIIICLNIEYCDRYLVKTKTMSWQLNPLDLLLNIAFKNEKNEKIDAW